MNLHPYLKFKLNLILMDESSAIFNISSKYITQSGNTIKDRY